MPQICRGEIIDVYENTARPASEYTLKVTMPVPESA
jgi:hypothetical protein